MKFFEKLEEETTMKKSKVVLIAFFSYILGTLVMLISFMLR